MSDDPTWWQERAQQLLTVERSASLGTLWARSEDLRFLRENVGYAGVFEGEARLQALLDDKRESVAEQLRSGALSHEAFRESWEGLGFVEDSVRASTPADDYLEGLLQVSRLTVGEDRPPSGQVNMASRARRISLFLDVVQPSARDTVFDLGSGNGKFAVTVAASTHAQVTGVEYGPSYVASARHTAERLGMHNASFVCADARTADLSLGSVFYLFHPFYGEVAQAVAERLGTLAGNKNITVFAQGPKHGYAEYFLQQVDRGAFESRVLDADVLLLRSVRS
ncbi:MAG: class I SAM-dependent methyltransferase [Myxococcaceae bacterium]